MSPFFTSPLSGNSRITCNQRVMLKTHSRDLVPRLWHPKPNMDMDQPWFRPLGREAKSALVFVKDPASTWFLFDPDLEEYHGISF